jgi:hypothetical protein
MEFSDNTEKIPSDNTKDRTWELPTSSAVLYQLLQSTTTTTTTYYHNNNNNNKLTVKIIRRVDLQAQTDRLIRVLFCYAAL